MKYVKLVLRLLVLLPVMPFLCAATEGTATFMGRSGRSYTKDLYLSDTADTGVNFDSGAGASATSDDFADFPEPVFLADVALVTGAAQTKLHVLRNSVSTGNFLRHTLHLNTLAVRPPLRIPFNARDRITLIQIA
ncbi:unnamed protein product [marine sediment metagenome]|uniref:Uncharacterized protein n=1 Tax=marine sediment metagenome TaxID=412755 RepID=X1MNE3_9ZZZZ